MSLTNGVRIVKHGPGPRDVDVYDLETGAKLLRVYAIDLVCDAAESPVVKVRITADIPFVYEGPAEFVPRVPPDNADAMAAIAEAARWEGQVS